MSGYQSDFSKSNNAVEAEKADRLPLTHASKALATALNIPIAHAKAFLKSIGTPEWHHTSKFYNVTKYYDVSIEAIEEYRNQLDQFKYQPEQKEKKELLFKCWNFEKTDDARSWHWDLTNRDGKHTFSISFTIERIQKLKLNCENELNASTHKATQKKCTEILKALDECLTCIEDNLKKNSTI